MTLSENALSYLGQMEVKKDVTKDGINNPVYGNFGFVDKAFEDEMLEEGWHPGWAWCSIFAKVVAVNCHPEDEKILRSLFSPSAVQTFNNFKKAGYSIHSLPVVDSIVIWQSYKDGKPLETGHAGIVVHTNEKDPEAFESVEGNTSTKDIREGYIVDRHPHRVNQQVTNGLKVLGFIKL